MNRLDEIIELIIAMKSENTKKLYRQVLDAFTTFIDKPLNKISSLEALAYFAHLRKKIAPDGKPIADKTILAHYSALHSICEHLIDAEELIRNPFSAVGKSIPRRRRAEKRPTTLIEAKYIQELLALPEKSKKGVRDRALLALLFGAGLRRSEALALNLADVKTKDGVMYVELHITKAGYSQVRVVAQFAEKHIGKLIEQRKEEADEELNKAPLFPFYYASGKTRGRMDQRTLARAFRRYCSLVGISASPHSARATFASRLKSLGLQDRDVADALGHSTENMVRIYDKRSRAVGTESPARKLKY